MALQQIYGPQNQRIHYGDAKGSGLVMYSDLSNGTYSARKTLTPGRLTDAQRLADTELVLVAGAQISCTDTGVLWESNGSVWGSPSTLTTGQTAAVQSLMLANGFPLAQAIDAGASASFAALLGSYITVHSNIPVSEALMGGTTYNSSVNNSHVYVDPVNGSDTNSGYSPAAPKRTINTASWTSGMAAFNPDMFLILKRGYTYDMTAPVGGGSGMSGGRSIGSYGDPALPRPILRAQAGGLVNNSCLYSSDPDGARLCDIEVDCSAVGGSGTNYNGVRFAASSNTSVFRNLLISNVKVKAPRTGGGAWPAGIAVVRSTIQNTATPVVRAGQIRVEGCEVYNAGAHGIMLSGAIGYLGADGKWTGAEVLNNYVHDCGLDYDSHAITSTCDGTYQGSGITWVLVSGTTYYVNYSALIGRSIGDLEMVELAWYSVDGTFHNLSKNTATPTTPAVGEFGFDNGTQRLYININGVPASGDELHTSGVPPRGVTYAYNRCENMLLQGNTAYTEGAGLQFDDWTSDSIMICNTATNNGGAGFAINRGQRNKIVRNMADGNGRCGILTNGHGTIIGGNVVRGGSSRASGQKGLICQDMVNGPTGAMTVQMRRNLMIATSQIDAYIAQTDASGYRGNFTVAAGNQGIGPATQQTIGKVLGF